MKLKSLLFTLFAATLMLQARGVKWIETSKWSGAGVLETRSFEFHGDEWRLFFTGKLKEKALLELVDLESGKPLAYVSDTPREKGTITMKDDTKGLLGRKVYFRFNGPIAGWQASLQEFVGQIEAFDLSRPKKEPKLKKYGIWCGDGGENLTIPVTLPAKEWKITIKAEAPGIVTLKCVNDEDYTLADTILETPKETSTWIHTNAKVTITVNAAEKTPWTLTIETP